MNGLASHFRNRRWSSALCAVSCAIALSGCFRATPQVGAHSTSSTAGSTGSSGTTGSQGETSGACEPFSTWSAPFDLRGAAQLEAEVNAAADLDGDGNLDLLATTTLFPSDGGLGQVVTLRFRGLGDGGLGQALEAPPWVSGIFGAGDFNRDGIVDFLVHDDLLNPNQAKFRIVSSRDAGYAPPELVSDGGYLWPGWWSPVTADFNMDGWPDLAIVDARGVQLFYNAGDGGLLPPLSLGGGSGEPEWELAGDFDGDGRPDLLSSLGLFTFAPDGGHRLMSMGAWYYSTEADFNEDGLPDTAVPGGSCGISVYFDTGDGHASAAACVDSRFDGGFSGPYDVVAADVNGDGHADLVCSIAGNVSGPLELLLGYGDGGFARPIILPGVSSHGGHGGTVIADFNRDGRDDLAFATDAGFEVLLSNPSCLWSP